jgi:hypothetical protein
MHLRRRISVSKCSLDFAEPGKQWDGQFDSRFVWSVRRSPKAHFTMGLNGSFLDPYSCGTRGKPRSLGGVIRT